MKKKNYVTSLLLVLLLTACGGGGSGNKTVDSGSETVDTGSGTVISDTKVPTAFLNANYYGQWSYVDTAESVNIISTTELNATVIEDDNNLLEVNENGSIRYLVRSGIASTLVEGKIEVDDTQNSSSSTPSRASSFRGIANIKIILSNVIDAHISEITRTRNDGSFTTTTLPTGLYNLEASDETLELKTVVEIKNKENNIGVYKLTGANLHNFKAELLLNEEYIVSDSKVHEAVLRVHNISDKIGFGLSYDIVLNDTSNDIGFTEGSASSVGSVQAKGYKDIPISFAFSKIASNSKVYGIDVLIKDALGNQWIDTFTFNVHKELVAILIETDKASVKGYLKNPITGEMKSIDTASGNILVPLMPEDTPYILILSNPSFANETKYSIGINTLPNNLEDFKDTAAQEPNNNQSEATSLYVNDVEDSYLHGTDIDYWKIYTQEGAFIDTSITNDFVNSDVAPASAPVLTASDSSEDKIVVNWNSINSATYYILEEKVSNSGSFSIIKDTRSDEGENIKTNIDINASSLSLNIIYYYRVKACNTQGCSLFSNVNSGKLFDSNQKPIANAGSDINIVFGEVVELNASLSSDNDGSINGYEWFKDNSTNSFSTKKIEDSVVFGLGTHEIALIVTDNKGAIGTDVVKVTVTAAPNNPPIAFAGDDLSVVENDVVTFSASQSTDSDGSIISYLWTEGATTISRLETFQKSFTTDAALTLTVTDDDGVTATDTIIVRVSNNPPPVVNIGADQVITEDENLTLICSASDSDGIASYLWQEGVANLGVNSSIELITLSVGEHTIRVTVTDTQGSVTNASVVVTVTKRINIVPVAVAAADNDIVEVGTSISLNATGSSDERSIVSYLWTEGSNTLGSLENITLSNLTVGVHTIILTVTDDDGASATDTITLTVNNPPMSLVTRSLGVYESYQTVGQIVVKDSVGVVTYVINDGQDKDKFSIDSSGKISFVETLPTITSSIQYHISITVTDEGSTTITNPYFEINFINIFHDGIDYSFVKSSKTGRIWLDKNIGANSGCSSTSFDDCGYYFQWARDTDGHEKYRPSTRTKKISKYQNSSEFVLTNDQIGSGDNDWYTHSIWGNNAIDRQKEWAKTNGYSICPRYFRVPTIVELNNEFKGKTVTELQYGEFKITPAGYKTRTTRSAFNGPSIYLWSQNYEDQGALSGGYIDSAFAFGTDPTLDTSIDTTNFNRERRGFYIEPRSTGMQVRCIQN